jgi:hypothetical protein
VVELVIEVRALADDLAVVNHDAAYLRIGRGKAEGRARKVQCAVHKLLVDLALIVRRALPNIPSGAKAPIDMAT